MGVEALAAENIAVVASVWIILGLIRKLLPMLWEQPVWARLSPLLPILMCSGIVWIPGILPDGTLIGQTITTGIVLGAFAGQGHKIFGQTVLGNDKRIKGSMW